MGATYITTGERATLQSKSQATYIGHLLLGFRLGENKHQSYGASSLVRRTQKSVIIKLAVIDRGVHYMFCLKHTVQDLKNAKTT